MALAVLATACGNDGTGDDGSVRSGAPFRAAVRDVHDALLTESCKEDPSLARANVLAREREAVAALEGRYGSGPAGFHIAVATSDVRQRQSSGTLGCWEDSDPAFAKKHVEMARNAVRLGLKEMEVNAPGLTSPPSPATGLDPLKAAEFRSFVRDLSELLNPLCQITTAGENDQILASATTEALRLRQRLQETPYAIHYDIAAADLFFEQSLVVAECADPALTSPAATSLTWLREATRRSEKIAAAANL
jgi:hypothetical protein